MSPRITERWLLSNLIPNFLASKPNEWKNKRSCVEFLCVQREKRWTNLEIRRALDWPQKRLKYTEHGLINTLKRLRLENNWFASPQNWGNRGWLKIDWDGRFLNKWHRCSLSTWYKNIPCSIYSSPCVQKQATEYHTYVLITLPISCLPFCLNIHQNTGGWSLHVCFQHVNLIVEENVKNIQVFSNREKLCFSVFLNHRKPQLKKVKKQ